MGIYSVIIGPGLIVWWTNICLVPCLHFFLFPTRKHGIGAEWCFRPSEATVWCMEQVWRGIFSQEVSQWDPEECPGQGVISTMTRSPRGGTRCPVPTAFQDKVPHGGTTCCDMKDLNDGQACAPKHYWHLHYWHDLKVPKIQQKDSLNI